jgi:gamma-glutamyltranspeptidase/glutathione hydrolase
MIARFDIADQQGWTPRAAHIVAEAMRLGYADRDRFMADPAFADVPYKAIASPAYARERAALIDPEAAMAEVAAGEPTEMAERASDSGPDAPSTSHFSIRDADGDIVSVTTSVEFPFGSHIMAGGFILNNQLTDFAFEPVGADGKRKANALAPGKRPRSSMSPVIVLDEAGRPLIATGSPGGTAIIAYVVKSLVAMLEWGWAAEEAVAYTNLYARGDTLYLEEGQAPEPLIEALETLGHSVETRRLTSGAHIVSWNGEIGAWQGAADPRREGTVSIWREGEADGDGSQE